MFMEISTFQSLNNLISKSLKNKKSLILDSINDKLFSEAIKGKYRPFSITVIQNAQRAKQKRFREIRAVRKPQQRIKRTILTVRFMKKKFL